MTNTPPTLHARPRKHIKAVTEEITEAAKQAAETEETDSALFLSGMATGLAVSLRIIDGATAEQGLELVTTALEAAVGRAHLDGTLPTPAPTDVEPTDLVGAVITTEAPAETDWESLVRQRERELKREGQQRHEAETTLATVRKLAATWHGTTVPLGTSVSRWWDARLIELNTALDGPSSPVRGDRSPTYHETVCTDPADHAGPHGGPLTTDQPKGH